MSVIYLTESDVERFLDMPAAILVVEEAFRRLASGEAENSPRVRVKALGIVLHSMTAAAGYLGYVGGKTYATTQHGARFLVQLWNQHDGTLAALIEADKLGQMRTGAVTGVAVKYLTPSDSDHVGLFGSGWQAESQLAAVAAVRQIRRATVYSRDPQRRRQFATRMTEKLGIEVVAADQPQQAAAEMPIVITATTSRTPVFDGTWLSPGTLVCAVGSNWLNKAEVDVTAVQSSHAVVCDSIECCQREAGDLVAAIQQGKFDWGSAVELSAVVSGNRPPRSAPSDKILFKSVGMAIEDIAVAAKTLAVASQRFHRS